MATKKLSDDDRILWGKVARTTRALPGRMDEIDAFEAEFLAAATKDLGAIEPKKVQKVGAAEEPAKPVKKQPGQHQMLEHSFISRAHERGLRHVLVITGKGSSMGSEGALKRAVPMWFSKPEFRHLISSYETSAQKHGGEGALYVRLSKPGGDRL